VKKVEPSESNPILFYQISKDYLRAFDIIWQAEFADKHWFYWDKFLIISPVAHLMGVSLETAIKGRLACCGPFPTVHDLVELLNLLQDESLENECKEAFLALDRAQIIFNMADPNPDPDALEKAYRSHLYHVRTLNALYGKPYATRYPVIGVHSSPNLQAIREIILILHRKLETESRRWCPHP